MANGADRRLEVAPERIARWLTGFGERHSGVTEVTAGPDTVRYVAADGSRAVCRVPFPPLEGELAEHALRDRRVGVLLARLGGYAAGVFEGDRLVVSKVGSRLVHGRSAAGGWSQHRFARRREKQAREALQDAAEVAARILTPQLTELDAVVLGGDRRAIEVLREDPRLAKVFELAVEPFLTVPDPKLAVLRETPPKFRAVRILLHEPS